MPLSGGRRGPVDDTMTGPNNVTSGGGGQQAVRGGQPEYQRLPGRAGALLGDRPGGQLSYGSALRHTAWLSAPFLGSN